jgi:hypothetical protein
MEPLEIGAEGGYIMRESVCGAGIDAPLPVMGKEAFRDCASHLRRFCSSRSRTTGD